MAACQVCISLYEQHPVNGRSVYLCTNSTPSMSGLYISVRTTPRQCQVCISLYEQPPINGRSVYLCTNSTPSMAGLYISVRTAPHQWPHVRSVYLCTNNTPSVSVYLCTNSTPSMAACQVCISLYEQHPVNGRMSGLYISVRTALELKRIPKINIRIFVTTILFVFEYSSMLYKCSIFTLKDL
jgi:hypothetical protein